MPVLEQLATLYPHLFGATFLPLKRGIFQDITDGQPEVFERDLLKEALALHTRSTRYLTAVASGQQRHDLAGAAVEAMAPEHVHHALLEVFRRRSGRASEAQRAQLQSQLRERIVLAFEASGLSAEAYAELVRSRDEATNAALDAALAEAAGRAAKDEALLRAFSASGQTIEAFADMYGMDPRAVAGSVTRAQRPRAVVASAAVAVAATTEADPLSVPATDV
jgi:ProP effector